MITSINDHIQRAKDRLMSQYKDKPNLGFVVESLVEQIQDLEDVFVDLCTSRTIDLSAGTQLDLLGSIVGISREPGQLDDDYRLAIKVRIGQNISEGEPESIISSFRTLTGAALVILNDGYFAEVSISSELNFTQSQVDDLVREMKKVIAAGVRLSGIGSFGDPSDSFAFAGNLPGKGFGTEADNTVGGKFSTFKPSREKQFAFDGPSPNNSGFGTVYDPLIGGVMI